jgi:hypothetical protein
MMMQRWRLVKCDIVIWAWVQVNIRFISTPYIHINKYVSATIYRSQPSSLIQSA